jgi:DNA-binding XRE family transcriptional regulator
LPKSKKFPRTDAEVAALRKVRKQVGSAIASLLQSRRQDADVTQDQMGYALEVTRYVVSNNEAYRTPISIEDAIAYWLITGEGSPADELADFCASLQFALRKVLPRK